MLFQIAGSASQPDLKDFQSKFQAYAAGVRQVGLSRHYFAGNELEVIPPPWEDQYGMFALAASAWLLRHQHESSARPYNGLQ